MQKYIRCHIVEAEPMTRGEHLKSKGLALIPGSGSESDEGYFIQYPDGYKSWCPKDSFEKAARPVDGMTFGQAVEVLKQGQKVARKGWNGRGQFVYYIPADRYVAKTDAAKSIAAEDGKVSYRAYLALKTAQGDIATWVPSISDCLAEDWVIA